MQLITFTERELDALIGEPAEVMKLYVCLRRRMDFQTGLVGASVGVSWWALREDMFVEYAQGRRREDSGTPTEKMVRNKLDRLADLGLVESRTSYRKLVFFLPLAHKAEIRLKKVGRTLVGQAGQTLAVSESLDTQCGNDVYPQEAGRTDTREVGHTSGIRVNNLSECIPKQQHRQAVDNSESGTVLLLCQEIVRWLKTAERRRGKIVAVSEADAHVKSWVSREVTLDALEQAHALAVSARARDHSEAPINAGFLNLFVSEAIATERAWPWHESKSGIEEKARQLGIEPLPGEQFPYFKRRVFAAAGLSEDGRRP